MRKQKAGEPDKVEETLETVNSFLQLFIWIKGFFSRKKGKK